MASLLVLRLDLNLFELLSLVSSSNRVWTTAFLNVHDFGATLVHLLTIDLENLNLTETVDHTLKTPVRVLARIDAAVELSGFICADATADICIVNATSFAIYRIVRRNAILMSTQDFYWWRIGREALWKLTDPLLREPTLFKNSAFLHAVSSRALVENDVMLGDWIWGSKSLDLLALESEFNTVWRWWFHLLRQVFDLVLGVLSRQDGMTILVRIWRSSMLTVRLHGVTVAFLGWFVDLEQVLLAWTHLCTCCLLELVEFALHLHLRRGWQSSRRWLLQSRLRTLSPPGRTHHLLTDVVLRGRCCQLRLRLYLRLLSLIGQVV